MICIMIIFFYWFSMSFPYMLLFIYLSGTTVIFHIFWILINFFQIFDELSLWRAFSWIHPISELIFIITFFNFFTSRKNMNRTTQHFQGLDFFYSIFFSDDHELVIENVTTQISIVHWKTENTTDWTTSWSWLYVYIEYIMTSITNIFKRQEIWSSYTKKYMTIKNW